MFRNREKVLKIVVWLVVFTMVLAVLAAIVPLVS